jgi:hypothetical protein
MPLVHLFSLCISNQNLLDIAKGVEFLFVTMLAIGVHNILSYALFFLDTYSEPPSTS